jgi:hypothetical protein
MIGLIRQELLSGIKTTEQYEKLKVHLRSFPDEIVDTSDYEEAAKSGHRSRSKGVAVSILDILLCAIAIKRQWAIFTTDPDFPLRKGSSPPESYAPATIIESAKSACPGASYGKFATNSPSKLQSRPLARASFSFILNCLQIAIFSS